MSVRAVYLAALAVIAALGTAPLWAPQFTITLLNYIGIYALVALGVVLLTGVAGLTSFGQAAFVGIGAYATAWLTTAAGASPWWGLAFALLLTGLIATLLGATSGILIGPVTTLYYDSGFIIGLKAFVGAIIGGLVSYPGTAIGAILVGILESFASFWNSSLKEVVVFSLLIPVLLLRSLSLPQADEEDAEIEA